MIVSFKCWSFLIIGCTAKRDTKFMLTLPKCCLYQAVSCSFLPTEIPSQEVKDQNTDSKSRTLVAIIISKSSEARIFSLESIRYKMKNL